MFPLHEKTAKTHCFASRAFIDYCILNGTMPYWGTDEDNLGSQLTAEKCGFELYKKCKIYYFPFLLL